MKENRGPLRHAASRAGTSGKSAAAYAQVSMVLDVTRQDSRNNARCDEPRLTANPIYPHTTHGTRVAHRAQYWGPQARRRWRACHFAPNLPRVPSRPQVRLALDQNTNTACRSVHSNDRSTVGASVLTVSALAAEWRQLNCIPSSKSASSTSSGVA